MNYLRIVTSALFLSSLSVGVANAQESGDSSKYHPFLSSTFQVGLGVYAPAKKNKIGASSDNSDLEQSLDSSEDEITGLLNFRWRYTENWSFEGNIWTTSSDSEATLNEDFVFQGDDAEEIVFQAGTSVGSGLDTSIARLFWGRSFNRSPNTDWGIGVGLHWMKIDVYVEGEVLLGDGGGTGFQRGSASVSAPLPNFGIWYMHSWSPKWVFTSRLDWLDVTFDQVSGSLLDASIGVNYQVSDRFGVGLAVNAFDLNVSVDGDDGWSGDLESSQYGPRLNLTWNW